MLFRSITNGVDLDIAGGEHPPAHIPGVPDEAFVAMYVGNHGTYSSLGTVLQAAKMGAHVCTMPMSVIDALFNHPLTDIGNAKFLKDWEKVPGQG